jgi:hypothetical protein
VAERLASSSNRDNEIFFMIYCMYGKTDETDETEKTD